MPDDYNLLFPERGSFPGIARDAEPTFSPASGFQDARLVVLELLLQSFPRSGSILAMGDDGDFHARMLSAHRFHVVTPGLNRVKPPSYHHDTRGIDRIISAEEHLDCIKDGSIDGLFWGKGWLNGFRNIGPALYHAFRVLKDNGACVLVLRNRFSIAESLAYIQRGQFRHAFQRARRNGAFIPGDNLQVMAWYHSLRSVKRASRSLFTIQKVVGLNIITPPPSFHHIYRAHPRLLKAAVKVENRIRSFPLLSVLGDHIIVILERFE